MKKINVMWVAVAVVILAVVLYLLPANQKSPAVLEPKSESDQLKMHPVAEAPPASGAKTEETPPVTEAVNSNLPVMETITKEGSEPEKVIRVRPGQPLASVNGVVITLADLAAIHGLDPGADQVISAHMYDYLLNRAIEREVAFQSAKARGIELSAEQKTQLEQTRTEMAANSPDVVDVMGKEKQAFELRDTEGRMLMVNLVAHEGAPSAFVTPEQVNEYYESHKTEFEALPSDPQEKKWAQDRIDRQIRGILEGTTAQVYQQNYDRILGQLKTDSNIQIISPVEK